MSDKVIVTIVICLTIICCFAISASTALTGTDVKEVLLVGVGALAGSISTGAVVYNRMKRDPEGTQNG